MAFKKFRIFILFLFIAVSAYSQQWEVIGFEKNISDPSAKIVPPKPNYELPYALIKISIPSDNVEFVSDHMVDVEPERKNGYWWVYVFEKAQRLRVIVNRNDVVQINFNDYDISIDDKVTYRLQIKKRESPIPEQPKYKPLSPERFTADVSVIGGTNFGVSAAFTASYFLIGVGFDWVMIPPIRTKSTNLINSGYIGNFTKEIATTLSGSSSEIRLSVGGYFKYFSLGCQVGWLSGTVSRTMYYAGSGQGLVDGDLSEYWGTYEHRSFETSTVNEEDHLTLTPQVKGYIPVGKRKGYSLSVGIGYTFIPAIEYNMGLSGSLGIHGRF